MLYKHLMLVFDLVGLANHEYHKNKYSSIFMTPLLSVTVVCLFFQANKKYDKQDILSVKDLEVRLYEGLLNYLQSSWLGSSVDEWLKAQIFV